MLIGHVLGYYWLNWRAVGAVDLQSFFHHFLGEGLLTAGALLGIVVYASALLFGRLFCSWGCHFGATQDLAAWIMRRLGWRPRLVRTRFLHWFPYFFLAVIFFLPVLSRRLGEDWSLSVDLAAVAPWDTLPGWFFSVITFLACGAGILLFLGTRGFCRYVCPYGALFRMTDRVTPFRVRRTASCSGAVGSTCAGSSTVASRPSPVPPCTAACPTAIDVHVETHENGAVTSPDCVRCNLCIEACPNGALAYTYRSIEFEPSRFDSEVTSGGASSAAPTGPTMSLWAEAVVAAVTLATYLLIDLVYGGHFLAATLALGEGFLAYAAIAVCRRSFRRGKAWTFLGVTAVGAFALSCVPLFEAGAFKILRYKALQIDPGSREATAVELATDRPEPGGVQNEAERETLQRAAELYRRASEYFRRHTGTLHLLLSAYLRLHDRRAVEVAERLYRLDDSSFASPRELLYWVYLRFGELEKARLLETRSD